MTLKMITLVPGIILLTFRAQVEEDGYVRVLKCADGAKGNDIMHLRRLHSVHLTNPSLKRLIAFLSGTYENIT